MISIRKALCAQSQLLSYVGAGTAAGVAILFAMYPDRAVFHEKRPDITRPPEWPLIGSLPQLLSSQERIYELMLESAETFGSTCTFTALAFPRYIATVDPRNIEHFLKTNFDNYIKGHVFGEVLDPLFGHGIFNADGPEWRYQRKTASNIFNVKNFRDEFTAVFVKEISFMKEKIFDRAAEAGTEVDFHEIMFKFTLDSFVILGFGTDLGALKQNKKLPFAAAFDAAQAQVAYRFLDPFWKVEEFLNRMLRPWRPSLPDHIKVVDDFASKIIEQRRNDPDRESKGDLLSRFMNTHDENGNPLNDKQLRDMVLNFIIAGRDTTAQALSWTFYELSRHPEVEEKLLAEIVNNVTDDITPNQLYETIKDMKYAHAVFYEVLRLYPSVPINQKLALADDVWPDGTHIKAGDHVLWCPHAQGRLESVWGADAKEFRPERWIVDGSLRKVSQGEWPAFNGGPRVCLGQNLATLEALVTLSLLLKQYHFSLVPGQNIKYAVSLTLPMKNGMRMRLEKRKL